MKAEYVELLESLRTFVADERDVAQAQLLEVWNRPLHDKLTTGWTQSFEMLESASAAGTLWAHLGSEESRWREGDHLVLHTGHPLHHMLGRHFVLEADEGDRWLLRGKHVDDVLRSLGPRRCYADVDGIYLGDFFEATLDEVASSQAGREVLLPLLCGHAEIEFNPREVERAEQAALQRGFNARQAEAVGLAVGAEQVACIQGPPGTGKSAVLALAVRLLVERGQRVLVTSHTHMAINHALNKIAAEGVPVVKIGAAQQCKGLEAAVPHCETFAAWEQRPARGYVVGATPFATRSRRLQACEFDVIAFDEASQVTVPLALMAMCKGRRYVFVGDQQQLPPVVLSRSVLDAKSMSAFVALTSLRAGHSVMLDTTYRMNRWLAEWPSRTYYRGQLRSAGPNQERRLALGPMPARLQSLLGGEACAVFVPALDATATTRSVHDAHLVADMCSAAVAAGLLPHEMGVVTPYRAQGSAVRSALRKALGADVARAIVADTVERMQGQERELIVVSMATGDLAFLGAVAEFFFQPQRLNVAITRAKTKLIVIGPALDAVPVDAKPEVQAWVAKYIDLLRHLTWVDVASGSSHGGVSKL